MGKRLKLAGAAALVAATPLVAGIVHVLWSSAGKVYPVDDVPRSDAALVLGARAYPDGPSSFLAARLDVAADLYRAGAVERLIVSGDGSPSSHNEPLIMREYLVEEGIPADAIVEDPGGFDTYLSCVRARDEYDAERVTIVSQDYHVRRALTICASIGLDAVAVEDTTMRSRFPLNWIRGLMREPFANLKMEVDLLTHP